MRKVKMNRPGLRQKMKPRTSLRLRSQRARGAINKQRVRQILRKRKRS